MLITRKNIKVRARLARLTTASAPYLFKLSPPLPPAFDKRPTRPCFVEQKPRVLLITRKNIKVRARLARLTTASATLYKQGYDQAITAVVDEHGPTEMVLR